MCERKVERHGASRLAIVLRLRWLRSCLVRLAGVGDEFMEIQKPRGVVSEREQLEGRIREHEALLQSDDAI